MSKLIVTHISPDLDAITSSFLIKKYLPQWQDAEFAFVPSGETYEGKDPDINPNIIHVDTGMGKFDHHQDSERSSATKKVFEFLSQKNLIKDKDIKAIEDISLHVTDIDNFKEVSFPDPTNIRYSFCLHEFLYPLRSNVTSDHELVSLTFILLESILQTVKNNLKAEEEIKMGLIINNSMGKVLFMETKNEVAVKYALKKGFEVVVRRDPETNNIRIKTQPTEKYNLTELSKVIIKNDKKATWFLHASKNMLLNGSSKNPNSVASALTTKKLIEILTQI